VSGYIPSLSYNKYTELIFRFICAVHKKNMTTPTLFRTWKPGKLSTYNCTIVEGVRATSAIPGIFKDISIGNEIKERFIGGGLLCNNPVAYVLTEAQSLFPSGHVACIVSIGTGMPKVIGLAESDGFQKILPQNLIKVLKDIATDCEGVSEQIGSRFTEWTNFYFRFNVDRGLQDVSLAEWKKLEEVKTHTNKYLEQHDIDRKVDFLVNVLQDQPAVLPAAFLGES
jgi:predicted acylesterase/phospholipase RssA